MMRIDPQTLPSSELRDLIPQLKDIRKDKLREMNEMTRVGARDDAASLAKDVDELQETIDGIYEELTRRRTNREARQDRQRNNSR